MSDDATKKKKFVPKKKVNHYNLEECKNEIIRLDSEHGRSSRYGRNVEDRFNILKQKAKV